ncbi:EEIG1/EHBP1 N-terminal domain protein [Quillaja saponaria]|uniref:EEIG1/EHBP1 N-terminal domain protein n=1 Tax=Quillaja saponaria TaxID=32244 RepID=A0AAD7LIW8_QUISA|nr:EEIG1/EHBP1 N-terminal domain protein [Quillaja saponaria]
MKMKYLKPWMQGKQTKNKYYYQMKIKQLKLEFGQDYTTDNQNQMVAIKIIEKRLETTKPGLIVPFLQTSKRQRQHSHTTELRFWRKEKAIEWEINNLCDFHVVAKDGSFCLWEMEFHILMDENADAGKAMVVGKISLDIKELGVKEMESMSEVERKLPIVLKVGGLSIEANLLVHLSFAQMRNSESERNHGLIKKVKNLTSFRKKNGGKNDQEVQVSSDNSDQSSLFDSEESNESITTSSDSSNNNAELVNSTELELCANSVTQLDNVQKSNWSTMTWDRSFRKFSFRAIGRNKEKLTSNSEPLKKTYGIKFSSQLEVRDDKCKWEDKEFQSRDGHAKLKTNVFFASFDQRSEKASGESACTALVALIAHWLLTNQNMPTRTEFDSLLTDGSSEWRKLCNNEAYLNLFPDKHFDLETVIEANLRPLAVLPEKSYTGFFSPGKFEFLKGVMSFDEIWTEINSKVFDYQPRIYIVSWNDHFFVLKVDADAYYIIDSLGERLFEGCKQAYILKFDDLSLMCAKVDQAEANSKAKSGTKCIESDQEEKLHVICRGKECCKEFIKRFLAAIPVRELEEDEKKGMVSSLRLHRQLQIEFHYSSSSCSSSATSPTISSFSSEECLSI